MDGVTFDTLRYVNRLIKGGFTRDQAEAMAEASSEASRETVAARELATRHDVDNAAHALRADLDKVKYELRVDLDKTKHELLKWIVGLLIAQTALLATAFGVMFSVLK